MSKAATSPTARLLQSSRLFSLPRSLPDPAHELLSSNGAYRASDTATLPYPVRQAIATPPSSHFRGDWGAKRPLPARATRGPRAPHIRISAQDTPEQITDFSSATDHTMTSLKWRELGIPMTWTSRSTGSSLEAPSQRSVFDQAYDQTNVLSTTKSMHTSSGHVGFDEPKQRWKFSGPWVAGMQDGEFQVHLLRGIDGKQKEWHSFLRRKEADRRLADAQRSATHDGRTLTAEDLEELNREVSDLNIDDIQKELRDEHMSSPSAIPSKLATLVCEFLDIPNSNMAMGSTFSAPLGKSTPMLSAIKRGLQSKTTPASTHPSAGLSYVRTNAIMDNDPLHGPQWYRAPILSRVVRPRSSALGTEQQAKLGIAGVVTNDPVAVTHNASRVANAQFIEYDPNAMASRLDINTTGGNKMWVHPVDASVDGMGRIKLQVIRGDLESIAVKTGNVESVHESRRRSATSSLPGTSSSLQSLYASCSIDVNPRQQNGRVGHLR